MSSLRSQRVARFARAEWARCASFIMSHRTDERARGEPSRRLELSRARRREAKPNHGNHRKLLAARVNGLASRAGADGLTICGVRQSGLEFETRFLSPAS